MKALEGTLGLELEERTCLCEDVVHVLSGADLALQLSSGHSYHKWDVGHILINKTRLAGWDLNLKMPRRKGNQYYSKYTKIFSNVANPFHDIEFQTDT